MERGSKEAGSSNSGFKGKSFGNKKILKIQQRPKSIGSGVKKVLFNFLGNLWEYRVAAMFMSLSHSHLLREKIIQIPLVVLGGREGRGQSKKSNIFDYNIKIELVVMAFRRYI